MNIGPKVDLFKKTDGTYKFRDYVRMFAEDCGKDPEVIEFHLLMRDIKDPDCLNRALDEVSAFASERALKAISFHYPDEQVPSEVRWIRNTLVLSGRTEVREGMEIPSPSDAFKRFYRTAFLIKQRQITPTPILVTHKAGVQLDREFFGPMPEDRLRSARESYLRLLLKEHKEILDRFGDNLKIGLENISNVAWGDNEGYICEQAFEHFLPRLNLGGVYVLDTAHAAMCAYHRHQSDINLRSMRSVESEQNPSLESLEAHIQSAGPHIGLIHLCDATGARFRDEGLPLGVEGSIIDWPRVISHIDQYAKEPNAVLEIKGAHSDYPATIGASIKYLKEIGIIGR